MNSQVEHAVGRLRKSSDGLDPVVRLEMERRAVRLQKRGLVGTSILMGVANVILALTCAGLGWAALHHENKYFATDHGRISPLYPLDAPYRTPADVIAFAKSTAERAFTLDFNNYRSNLEDARVRFTRPGFSSYIEGLKGAGMFDTLNKRMNLTSSTGVGVLVQEGEEEGTYAWVVRFPLTLKFVGQNTEMPEQKMMATVRVRRIPTVESIEGIGVAQIITAPL